MSKKGRAKNEHIIPPTVLYAVQVNRAKLVDLLLTYATTTHINIGIVDDGQRAAMLVQTVPVAVETAPPRNFLNEGPLVEIDTNNIRVEATIRHLDG